MLYMDLVVFLFALYAYTYLDRRLFLLFIHIIVGIGVVIVSDYTGRQGNNIYLSYIYAPYELIMMSAILYPSKEKSALRKAVLAAIGLALLVNLLEGLLLTDGFSRYNSLTYCIINATVGALALHQLLQLRYNPDVENLNKTPLFWVALGIAIHNIGLFIVWAGMRLAQDQSMDLLWHLTLIREIVIYLTLILWIIAFYTSRKFG